MFIKSLSIISKNSDELLRKINFKKGVNFIVDAEESDKHNKVGKTTCLKLLDLSLGAKNKDAIYKDYETNGINEVLKTFIEGNQVYTELVLTDNLEKPNIEVTLKTELFHRGARFINGEKIRLADLNKTLNELLFNNNSQLPSFRSSIKSFVRILMTRDNNQFLKLLDNFSKISDYRMLYNFLFEISDPKIDSEIGNLKSELKKIEESQDRYQKVNNFTEVTDIEQINIALEQEIRQLELDVDDIIDRKSFESNQEKINKVRQRYEDLSRELNRIDFDIFRIETYIKETMEKSEKIVSEDLAKQFFQEISDILPEITKTFSELVEFNTQLNHNKLIYFREKMDELVSAKENMENEIYDLVNTNSEFISLVENNKVDLYYEKINQLDGLKIQKAKNETAISSINNFRNQEQKLQEQIRRLEESVQKENNSYIEKMNIFNKHLKEVAKIINKERPLLVYNPDGKKFPVSITQLEEGTSTGTRKSLIAAYDIAYQQFAKEINKSVPNFIIHDVLESIEGDDLKALIDVVEASDIQYISAILKEKLVSSGLSQEEQEQVIILELSTKDRLFEGKLETE